MSFHKDDIREETVVVTRTIRTLTLNTPELVSWLKRLNLINDTPCIVDAHVDVPGGGDWSNTKLDMSTTPIVITITYEREEKK